MLFVASLTISYPRQAWALDEQDARERSKLSGDFSVQKGSVFVYGDLSLDVLISVRILGAVAKSGVHYIPPSTDLVTLLSLAGGTVERADLSSITIRRAEKGNTFRVIKIDLEELISDPKSQNVVLQSNDTVLIPLQQSWISDSTAKTVGVITGIASIFLSVVVGLDHLK